MEHGTSHDIVIKFADYRNNRAEIGEVIKAVSAGEEGGSAAFEVEGQDEKCYHVLIFAAEKPVGTGCVTRDGRIGRLAVLKEWRGMGLEADLVAALACLAEEKNMKRLYIHAGARAVDFYRKMGFTERQEVIEGGTPRILMEKILE